LVFIVEIKSIFLNKLKEWASKQTSKKY